MHRAPLSFVVALAALSATTGDALHAQVPDGNFALACARTYHIRWNGLGGIFVGHPRRSGPMAPIQGLGTDLTGASCGLNQTCGANSIEIHPITEELLVGQVGIQGTRIHLHKIALNGLTVAASRTYYVGDSTSAAGGIVQTKLLPNDQVLVACHDVTGPIGSNANGSIGVVDLVSGIVSPLFTSWAPQQPVDAITVDLATSTVYIGTRNGTLSGDVHSISLANPTGTPTQIGTILGGITNLHVDANGHLLVGCSVQDRTTMASLYRLSRPSNVVTPLVTAWDNIESFAPEAGTGKFIIGGIAVASGTVYGVYHARANSPSPPVFLSRTESGGNTNPGEPMGLAIAPDPKRYGNASGTQTFVWNTEAGYGLPTYGNSGFAIQIANPANAPVTAVAVSASLAPANLLVPGFNLRVLIDPAQVLAGASLPTAAPIVLPLPLPNDNSLIGVQLFFQGFLSSGGGFAATDGLRITVL